MNTLRCPHCGHAYGTAETAMLGVFEHDNHLTASELATKLGWSRPMASNTAKKLCRKRHLTRWAENLPEGGKRYVYCLARPEPGGLDAPKNPHV